MTPNMQPVAEIPRIASLSAADFIDAHLTKNTPVVVTDAMIGWDIEQRWTPYYFRTEFGKERVHVYNDYFDFKTLMPLARYFDKYFDQPDIAGPVPYVRWYSKLRDVPFPWADAIFDRLRHNWQAPYFLPLTDYALPHAPAPQRLDPVEHLFPARGLFISGRGARTGLHVDPWQSDAILCQAYGVKEWVFFPPDQAALLKNEHGVVDPQNWDAERFPQFAKARPHYRFLLRAGETVYVPRGWFHQVTNVSDSISVTWNFVHGATAEPLRRWAQSELSEIDHDVMRLFVGADYRDVLRPKELAV